MPDLQSYFSLTGKAPLKVQPVTAPLVKPIAGPVNKQKPKFVPIQKQTLPFLRVASPNNSMKYTGVDRSKLGPVPSKPGGPIDFLQVLAQPGIDTFNTSFGERLGAFGRSLRDHSLQPLKESFAKQAEPYSLRTVNRKLSKQEMQNALDVAFKGAEPLNQDVANMAHNFNAGVNLAFVANLDAGMGGIGESKVPGKPIKPEVKPLVPEAPSVKPNNLKQERGFVTSVKEFSPEIKVSGQYIPRSTDRLAIKAKNLIKDNIEEANKVAMQGTDDAAVATSAELIKHYSEQAAKATDEATKGALNDRAAEVANSIARKLTEQGRAVQAASILGRLTPEGQVKFAAREIQKYNEGVANSGGVLSRIKKQVPELTGKQADEILTEMKAIQSMPEGEAKAIRFNNLQNKISELVPSPMLQRVTSVWKAGLLTGLKTTGVNIFSNLSHAATEIVKDVPATVVDSVSSLFTGKRTMALTGRGLGSGVEEGFKKGWRYLRTGYDERNLGSKLDYKKVSFVNRNRGKIVQGVQRGLQKYEESVFRIVGAEDQPFYYGAKARSLYSQAIAQAKNAGVKGAERTKFIENLVKNPSDDMLKYAVHDAEVAVFQNKTALGNTARGLQNLGGGLGELILPFGRTPAAVATQMLNYTPVGIVKTIVDNVVKGKFDQRIFSQDIGRAAVGTGALVAGAELFKKGLIALSNPTTDRERNQWELEGKKANAIKIGNKWRSVAGLGPIGQVLLIGANFQNGLDKTGSRVQALTQAGFGGLKSLNEQTFLQGLNQFTTALSDPEKSGSTLISSLISSTVPTLLGDVSKATDKYERNSSAKDAGMTAGFKAKIPWLRQTLDPRINAFGEKVNRIGNPFEIMADPTRPSSITSNELYKELSRLNKSGNLSTPTDFGNDAKYRTAFGKDGQLEMQMRAGMILHSKLDNLIRSESYIKLSDEEKSKIVQKFTDQARVVARAEALNKVLMGLNQDQQLEKLKELKQQGVLTKEVFDKWRELY